MTTSGIYKIQSIIKPERVYIGSANRIKARWNCHLSDLRKGKHHSPKLQNHYNKYGEVDLIFTILEPCLPQFLTIIENTYLKPLPFFNIYPIAGSPLGFKWSEKSKEKIRGLKRSEESKSKQGETNIRNGIKPPSSLGRHHSEESKRKTSDSNKEVYRQGRIPYLKGKHHSEESIQKMRKPKSEEFRQKLRGNKNALGHKWSEEQKQNHKGSNMLGKHHTVESKLKMREARYRYLSGS